MLTHVMRIKPNKNAMKVFEPSLKPLQPATYQMWMLSEAHTPSLASTVHLHGMAPRGYLEHSIQV